MRDTEITLKLEAHEPTEVRHARLQGKVYDQLYSPACLSLPDAQRIAVVEALAEESKGLIAETRAAIAECVCTLFHSSLTRSLLTYGYRLQLKNGANI
jgi:hypothetical protein